MNNFNKLFIIKYIHLAGINKLKNLTNYYISNLVKNKLGHDVLMVSLTSGDAGHQSIKPAKFAKIRREEARKAGETIGVEYKTLNNHDGKLMPTYRNRLKVIRLIREHKADIVISPRPYGYHPDHRYTGTLVPDAAYMLTVPGILAKVPATDSERRAWLGRTRKNASNAEPFRHYFPFTDN